jgi:hypothetical protein
VLIWFAAACKSSSRQEQGCLGFRAAQAWEQVLCQVVVVVVGVAKVLVVGAEGELQQQQTTARQ